MKCSEGYSKQDILKEFKSRKSQLTSVFKTIAIFFVRLKEWES